MCKHFQTGAEEIQIGICTADPRSCRDGLPHEPSTRQTHQPLLPESRHTGEAACEVNLILYRQQTHQLLLTLIRYLAIS